MQAKDQTEEKIKKIQNVLCIIILSCCILFGLLSVENQAVDEQTENNPTNEVTGKQDNGENQTNQSNIIPEETNNNNSNTSTNQPKATPIPSNVGGNNRNPINRTVAKSDNANLSDLGITPHDFSGFKYAITSYEITVPEDTESVVVYAKAQDGKAQVAGTGEKKLEKGENKIEVIVTAESGNKKVYTINIIREIQQEEEQQTNEEENQINGLVKLKIGNLSLSPQFTTDIYEYTVKYIGEDTKLNIKAEPTNDNYVVEIVGNENLKEGENIITILVSKENGDNVATYQITVNKSLVDEEAIAREEAQKMEQQKKIILVSVIVGIIILAIIVFAIIKRRKNRRLAEEFEEDYYDEEDYDKQNSMNYEESIEEEYYDDYEEEQIEELPKEELKKRFFDKDKEEYAEQYEEIKKKKHKGKRFK